MVRLVRDLTSSTFSLSHRVSVHVEADVEIDTDDGDDDGEPHHNEDDGHNVLYFSNRVAVVVHHSPVSFSAQWSGKGCHDAVDHHQYDPPDEHSQSAPSVLPDDLWGEVAFLHHAMEDWS